MTKAFVIKDDIQVGLFDDVYVHPSGALIGRMGPRGETTVAIFAPGTWDHVSFEDEGDEP